MTESHLVILALALLLDRFVGDPDWLWRRFPHPVVWFGKAISAGEKALYPENGTPGQRKRAGLLLIAGLVLAGWVAASFASKVFGLFGSIGLAAEVLVVAVLLAQKSLSDHVQTVRDGLDTQGIEGGRAAVAMIVGRDVKALDQSGVCRAAIESLAENASDGVVAPALAYMLFGLPGLIAYKLINTADSMIGNRSDRYLQFGWASARLDDVANFVPARVTGLLACAAFAWADGRAAAERSFRIMRRDAKLHKSPNAGWPEAAFAGGLDIALGGPRTYAGGAKGDAANAPWLNPDGAKRLNGAMIGRALATYDKMLWVMFGAVLVMAAF
ncbi:MAG: adenosylcobinamide-phosphate synthase CbiB [Rhizobiaceae bacterium]|nr:adenosylcobinamide-phosphate synthase CbiB [Rhizobiaceae bacterium]